MSEAVDISGYRLVSAQEVAKLWCITVCALKMRLVRGTFPVRPRQRRPPMWSSVDLREWFEDARKRTA